MNNIMLKLILIFGIFLTLIGCSQESKICASKAAEEELIKKANEQGLMSKSSAKKVKFTIVSVEESKISTDPKSGSSSKITICNAKGKLEYIDEIQNSYKDIQKIINNSYEFAKSYFNEELSSVKTIEFKIKKNELNDGVIIDGDWNELSSENENYVSAQPLSERIIDIIENKDKIIKSLNEVSVIWKFYEFLMDQKTDIAKSGKSVKEYILNNKIPVVHCYNDTFQENDETKFKCRIANEHSAMNIQLVYDDEFKEHIVNQIFEGKKPKYLLPIKDSRIESLIEKAVYVKVMKNGNKDNEDYIETFKLPIFKSIQLE